MRSGRCARSSRSWSIAWTESLAPCRDDQPPARAPVLDPVDADAQIGPWLARRLAAIGWRVLAAVAVGLSLIG